MMTEMFDDRKCWWQNFFFAATFVTVEPDPMGQQNIMMKMHCGIATKNISKALSGHHGQDKTGYLISSRWHFHINQPEVQYVKSGSTLNGKSSHLLKTKAGDGHCFFCSVSFLLTGNQSQHYKIGQQLCDYTESEENFSRLRAFLGHHNTGKDYVLSSKMRQQAWAT